MILAIRTDKPEAELYLLGNGSIKAEYRWHAHRQLSDTLLVKIEDLLSEQKLELKNVSGLIVYRGPGSFTGLRIGITVANTLSYSLNIPIVGSTGEDWLQADQKALTRASSGVVVPEYGAPVHITQPRK